VLEGGDRVVLDERPRMAARELAGVEHDRGDLAVADPDLGLAADQSRIEGVVAGIEAQTGSGGTRSAQRRPEAREPVVVPAHP
jgi:hypothetical protein